MGKGDMKGLMQVDGVQIVAVCDVFQQRRNEAKGIVDENYGSKDCKTYNDFRDLLARKDIDAVCITTQDHWHALIAIAAAKAGKDMYCQKPLGMTVAASVRRFEMPCADTVACSRPARNNAPTAVSVSPASWPATAIWASSTPIEVAAPGPMYKRRYKKPTTPEPVPAGFDFDMYVGPAKKRPYNGGLWAWPDWYLIRDYCVGFIVNWGVHHLDIANWGCPAVTSEPCELEFTGSYRDDGLTDNINDWTGEFRYESGLRMTYSDTGNPNQQGCTFRGDEGLGARQPAIALVRAGIAA